MSLGYRCFHNFEDLARSVFAYQRVHSQVFQRFVCESTEPTGA